MGELLDKLVFPKDSLAAKVVLLVRSFTRSVLVLLIYADVLRCSCSSMLQLEIALALFPTIYTYKKKDFPLITRFIWKHSK